MQMQRSIFKFVFLRTQKPHLFSTHIRCTLACSDFRNGPNSKAGVPRRRRGRRGPGGRAHQLNLSQRVVPAASGGGRLRLTHCRCAPANGRSALPRQRRGGKQPRPAPPVARRPPHAQQRTADAEMVRRRRGHAALARR